MCLFKNRILFNEISGQNFTQATYLGFYNYSNVILYKWRALGNQPLAPANIEESCYPFDTSRGVRVSSQNTLRTRVTLPPLSCKWQIRQNVESFHRHEDLWHQEDSSLYAHHKHSTTKAYVESYIKTLCKFACLFMMPSYCMYTSLTPCFCHPSVNLSLKN